MRYKVRVLARFLRAEDGAAASEYAILVALIVGAVAFALTTFPLDLRDTYAAVSSFVAGVAVP